MECLSGFAPLASRYDGFVLDIWGVIHDGVTLYPGVAESLERLHAADKKVVYLSNAPRRASAVFDAMVGMGLKPEWLSHIMTSGEAVWLELQNRDHPFYDGIGASCFHIGPARDENLFEGLGLARVARMEDAGVIVNTGPWHDGEEVADYEDRLARGIALGIPMLCANPDLVVIRGGRRIICAGALAARYEELGGRVRYLGKPKPSIYDYCFDMLGVADRARILAVGDSLRTDIAGASAAGIDAALAISGIHAEELGAAPGELPEPSRIADMCRAAGVAPVAALPGLNW